MVRCFLGVLSCSLLLLAGCGGTNEGNVQNGTNPPTFAAITGTVSGGQTAISGAHVYLLAVGSSGYGQASVDILSGTQTSSDSVGAYVASGSNGSFTLTGAYSCATYQQLYIYALGGSAGSASGLLAPVGNCPSGSTPANGTTPTINVTVNEVSTIATAYAFAGFATDATHVSSSGTSHAQVGIGHALLNAAQLATIGGVALATTAAGNGTVPQTKINALANILASCVGGSACSTLLSTATSDGTAGGTHPTDTATAAINIAHNPGANVATLYGLASSAVFTPTLSAQPTDFTLALNFGGGGLSYPFGVAIDSSGDAWVANYNTNSVIELSNLGAILSGASGFSGGGLAQPDAIAIDLSGNAWIANASGNVVTELASNGTIDSVPNGYAGAAASNPGLAIDGTGNVWVTGVSTAIEMNSSGTLLSGNGYALGGPTGAPLGIAIDGRGDAWISTVGDSIVELGNNSGAPVTGSSGYSSASGTNSSYGIAIDGQAAVWVTDTGNNSVAKLSSLGVLLSGSGFTGGGLSYPYAIAIDGSGSAWVANYSNNSVTKLSSSGTALSGASGFTGGGLSHPNGVAVDSSGDVWVTSQGTSSVNGSVTEFIGAAIPVATPLVANVVSNTLAGRP